MGGKKDASRFWLIYSIKQESIVGVWLISLLGYLTALL
jgi:hypothetical protein